MGSGKPPVSPLAPVIALLLSLSLAGCAPEPEPEQTADQADDITSRGAPVNWRMTSAFSSSLTMLGTMGKRLEEKIFLISNGNITLKFYEPGALAPPLEAFDAISYGAIEASWATAGYWGGKVPALQLFAAVPFGPDAPEYIAWYYQGGGEQIAQDIYHAHNIHGLVCGLSPPEASGWFKKKINSVDDLKGLKVRYFGLGARVLEKMGASAQLLAAGDIFPALELGVIDGAEFSMPVVDLDMGFYQVAKHYYFPGWHQQATFFELMINLESWNSLSLVQQAQIELVCGDNVRHGIAEGEASQPAALKTLQAKGVILETWPDEVLEALEVAWLEVAEEEAAKNADFRRAWESLSAFRAEYAVWRDLGYLK